MHCFVPTGCSWVYCMDVLVQLCNFSAAGCTTVPAMNPCTLYSVAYQPMINKYVTVHKKVSVGWGNEPIKTSVGRKATSDGCFLRANHNSHAVQQCLL